VPSVVVGQMRPTFPALVRRFRVLIGDGVVRVGRVCGPILAVGSLSLLVAIVVWPGPGHDHDGPHVVDLVVTAVAMTALGALPELVALAWLARIRLGQAPAGRWRRFVAGHKRVTLPVRLVGIAVLAVGWLITVGRGPHGPARSAILPREAFPATDVEHLGQILRALPTGSAPTSRG
jgi:hypothetical protein